MKQFIVYLMLIANLCSGVAFAWDSHFELPSPHSETTINLALHGSSSGNDPHHNDHCAHASAHLVGVFGCNTVALSSTSSRQRHNTFFESTFPSLDIPPLLRPPIE